MKKGSKGDGNFTVDVKLMCNISLPLAQRILYMWVLDYTRNNRTMFVPIERIAVVFGCSVRQARRYIKDLVDADLIVNHGAYGNIKLTAKKTSNCDTDVQVKSDMDVRDSDTDVQVSVTPMSNYSDIDDQRLDTDDKLLVTDVKVQQYIPNNLPNNLPNKLQCPRAHARDDTDTTRPTKDDVIAYCRDAGLTHINPAAFYDYYAAVNWMTGNSPIRSWQALCRRWDEEDKLRPRPTAKQTETVHPTSYTIEAPDYDFDIITNEEDFPF